MVRIISVMALLSIFTSAIFGFSYAAQKQDRLMNNDQNNEQKTATATFAGGCFWCMQPPFDKLAGVIKTTVGYSGGHKKMPTYREVTSGTTGHTEAIEVIYDPSRISYEELLDVLWRNIDPTSADRQFVDIGTQYRAAIFYHDTAQQKAAEDSKQQLARSGRFDKSIVTEISAATIFYAAEDYHQQYYKKNPIRYKFYRYNSGRDQFLKKVWSKEI